MSRTSHLSITSAVIVCLLSTQGSGTLFASKNEPLLSEASSVPATHGTSETQTPERSVFTLRASDLAADQLLGPTSHVRGTSGFALAPSSAFAGQVYQGRPYRLTHDGSIAAIMIGAAAAIAGAAVLVYANRPECDTHPSENGCGYGTKVVGGAVLSGGVVGLFVGALTWR